MIKSTKITSLVITGTHATIFLKATIDGAGEYDVRVEVDDAGEPGGGVDKFSI